MGYLGNKRDEIVLIELGLNGAMKGRGKNYNQLSMLPASILEHKMSCKPDKHLAALIIHFTPSNTIYTCTSIYIPYI